jgi:RNA polymerase sporulation-specific sigma factor
MLVNKVEICGVNTSKLPVLSNEEKKVLFERIHKGDASAREEFINGNLRLVLSVIQRFNNRGEYVDDLFQVGCIGLIKAIDNFDVTQNVRFQLLRIIKPSLIWGWPKHPEAQIFIYFLLIPQCWRLESY